MVYYKRQLVRIGILFYSLSFLYLLMWLHNIQSNEMITFQFKGTVVNLGNALNRNKRVKDVINNAKVENVTSDLRKFNVQSKRYRNGNQELNGLFKNYKTFFDNQFVGYDSLFALIYNVTLNPKLANGRSGGENISDVLNQKERDEFFTLNPGYFTLRCKSIDNTRYKFTKKNHLNTWYQALRRDTIDHIVTDVRRISQWTIAVQRYEYANLYHTMTDYYNAFLLAHAFQLHPDNVTILWVDGHPVGALDDTWNKLFGNVMRAGEIKQPILFENMLWGIMGYDSPLNQHALRSVSYLEEFRNFFLTRHGVSEEIELNCSNLTVTFLWRRNYLAHPRNPSGSVARKIKNEEELLRSVRTLLPQQNVIGSQIDLLPMENQLLLISKTDILIGMHGAGLSHTLFLPSHSGLIELYPTYWPSTNKHFQAMAKWRHLNYLSWINTDRTKELPDKYTIVNVDAVIELVKEMKMKMCKFNNISSET